MSPSSRLVVLSLLLGPVLASAQVTFVDVTSGALAEPVRSWAASFIDADADGDPDLFVSRFAPEGGNVIFRNDGGTFTAVDAGPLTAGPGSIGHTWADVDNDGDLDVLTAGGTGNAAGFGNTGAGVRLYLNDGAVDGGWTFRQHDAAPFRAADAIEGWTAAWADVDRDGRLDFVVAHPRGFVSDPDQTNHLYRQTAPDDAGPTFERVADSPVTTGLAPYTVATWSDYDLDGDPDLFIGSGPADGSTAPDYLYRNDDGAFTRLTEGVLATDERDGQVMNWQDIDNDGDLDLFVTSYVGGSPEAGRDRLYRNDGGTVMRVLDDPLATDVTGFSLANTWGDVDNDGDLDVFVTTGTPNADLGEDRLYLNDGAGRFTRAWTTDRAATSGATFGDIDGDGDLDLAVTTQAGPAGGPIRLYENRTETGNAWAKLRLVGTASNRSAIGARVEVAAEIGGRVLRQMREVSAQNTFNGQNDLTVHVGLGDATTIASIRVTWPSGTVDAYDDLAVRTTHVLREGDGAAGTR